MPATPDRLGTHHLHAHREFGLEFTSVPGPVANVVDQVGPFLDMDFRPPQVQADRSGVEQDLEAGALRTEIEAAPVVVALFFEQHRDFAERLLRIALLVAVGALQLDRCAFGRALGGDFRLKLAFASAGAPTDRFAGGCRQGFKSYGRFLRTVDVRGAGEKGGGLFDALPRAIAVIEQIVEKNPR